MRAASAGGRALTLQEQAIRVRFIWPTLRAQVTRNGLIVKGTVRPTPLADEYHVRVVYAYGEVPKAYVDSLELRRREDRQPIPHIYPGPRPCLYLPSSGEWSNRLSIASTIIPWLMLWLTYYELWHATGVWQGGGVEPAAVTPPAGPGGEQKTEPTPTPLEQASMTTPSEP
jgi:hypothetical protein